MPEPFKNLFNPGMVGTMAAHLARVAPGFDQSGFVADASAGLAALELKARAAHIAAALEAHLPPGWAGVEAMLAALHPEEAAPIDAMDMDGRGIRGWAVMPMADVVAARGQGPDFDRAMAALAAITMRFSAEFAVRPLILHDLARAMRHVRGWAEHPNVHMRRLASEGTRPRLPWGVRLAPFVADPAPLIPVLTRLRDDPEDYVRRSVANSLNDIAKDHPELVAELAADWLRDAPPPRARLVRHALRSLVKAGNPRALAALGYGPARVAARLTIGTPVVRVGEALRITVELAGEGEVVLDYAVHYRRANGGLSAKVFKWRPVRLEPGRPLRLARTHSFRPVTVRRLYPGEHRIALLANGTTVAEAVFLLEAPDQSPAPGRSDYSEESSR